MNDSKNPLCRTCKYFHTDGEKGQCRKYAPQAISPATASPRNKEGTCWPQVQPDDYCDEWVKKDSKMGPEEAKIMTQLMKKANNPKDPNMGLLDLE